MDVNKACFNKIGECTNQTSHGHLSLNNVMLRDFSVNEKASDFKLEILPGKE